MNSYSPVVVSGSIAIDRIMNFGGLYSDVIHRDRLNSLSVSVLLESSHDAEGGIAGNITYSMALLGNEPILLGSVGRDGLLYMERLAHLGVNIAHVYESELPTASFTVLTDGQQNQIGGFYPGAMFDSDSLGLEHWKDDDPIVMVSPHDPKAMRRQVEECKQWGLRLFYDVGQQVTSLPPEDMTVGVNAAQLLIVNEYEMSVLSKKIGQSTDDIKAKVPIVITTHGKDGSVIEGKEVAEPIKVGIVPAKAVLDPTGAGDAYRAGFLHGYVRGWPLQTCGQLGAVCATYAVETMGTQGHAFTWDDALARYKEAFGEVIKGE